MIDYKALRRAMVDNQVRPSDVTRHAIIAAFLSVPRELFVPAKLRPVAYAGEHVPIEEGRVLLDARTFAKLIDALEIDRSDLVLDIGAGLGYSAAILARLAEAVVALEEDAGLADQAEATLAEQGVDNVVLARGPLAAGMPDQGPYDVIVLEGGVERIPAAILDSLRPGGRIGAIFARSGPVLGHARVGVKGPEGISWRRVFDAAAPVLPGFAAQKAFEF